MEIIIQEHPQEGEVLAAHRIKNLVKANPKAVLGLATGQTPLGVYRKLIDVKNQQNINFSEVTTFNLDEYVGVAPDHPGSYAFYMKKNVFDPLAMNLDCCFIPNGQASDVAGECEAYENKIKERGPIDLQLLGLGRDGHIAFNEPGSSLGSRTRLKTLTETTRQDNAHLFSDHEEIPIHVMTMGIQTIMEAREILLLAFGESKADAVVKFVEGPLTAQVPASVLQLHPKVKVVLDEASASQLKNKDYYKEVFAKKPSWQNAEII